MNLEKNKSKELFNLESISQDSPRLKAIKAHEIKTHHAPHMEWDTWMAIPMIAARKLLEEYYLTDDEKQNPSDLAVRYCMHLENAGLIFLGDSKKEVEDAALAFLCDTTNPPL